MVGRALRRRRGPKKLLDKASHDSGPVADAVSRSAGLRKGIRMPPLVIDVRSAEDTRDCLHRAVQALAEGQLAALPTEPVYARATSALDGAAVARMLQVKRRPPGQPPLTLGLKSADEALDYVPQMPPLGQRLARRC